MSKIQKYDYIVIGAGSGGIATANRAASYGKKVAIIEKNILGGTCVNVGCVPKKIMWYAGYINDALRYAPSYGFLINKDNILTDFSWQKLVASREAYIKRIHQFYDQNFKKNNITVIKGAAIFHNANTLKVSDQLYFADHICIATGGEPKIPELSGAEYGITSDDFFALKSQPKDIVIVGSGYIAVELAGFLHSLGTKVTLIIRKDTILNSFDATIANALKNSMQEKGIVVISKAQVINIAKQTNNKLTIQLDTGKTIISESLLWAIGRKPLTSTLNLSAMGIDTDKNGNIIVDKYHNTNIASVYAIGDNIGKVQLTPVAIAAGRKLADRLFNHQQHACISYENIASVIFSHPPIGAIGLTEVQAINKFGVDNITIYNSKFKSMYSSVADDPELTHIKMVVHNQTDKILGLHIIGIGADEMLQGFAVAINMGATKQQFDNTIAIHPTSAEEVVLLK